MSNCTGKVSSSSQYKNYSVYKIKNIETGRYVSNHSGGVFVPDVYSLSSLSTPNVSGSLPVTPIGGQIVGSRRFWEPYISYGDLIKGRGNILLTKHEVANFFSRLIGLKIRSKEIADFISSNEDEDFSDYHRQCVERVGRKCMIYYDQLSNFMIEEIELVKEIPLVKSYSIKDATRELKDDVRRQVRFESCKVYSSYTLNTARHIYEKYKDKTLPAAYTSCYSKGEEEMRGFLVSAGITAFKYERDSYSFVLFNASDLHLYKVLLSAANVYEESILLTDLYPEVIRTEQLALEAIGDILD